jgi:hypothetical protein
MELPLGTTTETQSGEKLTLQDALLSPPDIRDPFPGNRLASVLTVAPAGAQGHGAE